MVDRARPFQPEALPPEPEFPDTEARPSAPEWIGFVVRSAARHPRWFLAVLVLGLAGTATFYAVRPPLYRATTKVLTQRHQSMPTLSRSATPEDAPTRTANELIRRRESLIALLRSANLMPTGGESAATSWTSRLLSFGDTTSGPEDALNAMINRLDKALTVTTGDGTITISVDWPDPQQAYALVEHALQNFLEVRQVQEITAMDESINLLHGRVQELYGQLEAAIREAQRTLASPGEPVPAPPPAPRTAPLPSQPSETLVRMRAAVEAKSRAVHDLEEMRNRRLAELQAQLNERRSVFSDAHPTVIALKGELNALSQESPQLAALREEETALRDEYNARLAAEEARAPAPSPRRSSDRATPRLSAAASAAAVNESERVRDARFRYTQMLERLNAAQLEMDSARAAFRHRYSILWPAQVPRQPISPNPVKIFGVGCVLSLMLAFAASALPDLRAGRIMERWQVERLLGIPVLAELRRR